MDIGFLKKTSLFAGMCEQEISEALLAMRAEERRFCKGARILRAGETAENFCMVLSGSVTIESNDIWGKRTILGQAGEGELFAESYCLSEGKPLMVDVVANTDCEACFFCARPIRNLAIGAKTWALKFMANLLEITAGKNLSLSLKSFHTSPKTIRERVLAYLNSLAVQKGERELEIPFDRQALADYLNVERTALSKELGKMRDEGIIKFRKNRFWVQ